MATLSLQDSFSCHSVNFYTQLSKEGNFWFFWITTESDQVEAEQFKVSIEVSSLKEDYKLDFSCHPVPVGLSMDKVKDSGNCLVMTMGQVKQLAWVKELDKNDMELCFCYDVSDDVADLVGFDPFNVDVDGLGNCAVDSTVSRCNLLVFQNY